MRLESRRALVALLLFGACHLRGGSGGSPTNSEDTRTQRGQLAASTTLSAAVTGKIQPIVGAPGDQISAGMPGEADVGDDGSASYRLPIWVPDGINGLQPSLAIEYNSEGGTSLLGPRWRLAGLSAIARCQETRAQDGVAKPLDFFGDTFCLDGQRMVVTGSSATDVEFRTERESYRKIVGTKNAIGDVYKFLVYERDGRILSYGDGYGLRLHGNPMTDHNGTQRDAVYIFYLDNIADRYGNSISIKYKNAVFTTSFDEIATTVQELVPESMTWGPTGARTVSFDYDPHPQGWINPQMRWVHGLGIGMAQYLRTITIKGPDERGISSTLKQYNLSYSTSPLTRTGESLITGDAVLSSISECDANNVCKKPTQIEWESGTFDSTGTVVDVQLTIPNVFNQNELNRVGQWVAADLDRDGLDDVIYRDSVPQQYAADGTHTCLGWVARLTQHGRDSFGQLGAPMPLTVLGADPDPTCRSALGLTPNGDRAYGGDIFLADLNNDGYPDVVSPVGTNVSTDYEEELYATVGYRAYLNDGTAHFSDPINFLDTIGQRPSMADFSNPKSGALAIGDTDGDGVLEVIRPLDTPMSHLASAAIRSSSLTWKTESRSGYSFPYAECSSTSCNQPIPDSPFQDASSTVNFSAIDLDGDGTAEILRDPPACPQGAVCSSMPSYVNVTSPTMNTSLAFAPAPFALPAAHPWHWVWPGSSQHSPEDMLLEGETGDFSCSPGYVISSIVLASYGTPNLTHDGAISLGTCNADRDSGKYVELDRCFGLQSCTVTASNDFFHGDPCRETPKRFALQFECSEVSEPGPRRWFLDLNGDGLLDIAWAVVQGNGDTSVGKIAASLNTGQGFTPPKYTTLPHVWTRIYSFADAGRPWLPVAGIRVTDFNLDGKQDLWAGDQFGGHQFEADNPLTGMVLISDGTGGFTFQDPGFAARLVLDINGDGLPDVLSTDDVVEATPPIRAVHIRQGNAPEMVTAIKEGNGRTVGFSYQVSSSADPSFYDVRSADTCDKDPAHLDCLNRARWLVSSLTISDGESSPLTQAYSYAGGVSDKGGRGFLGFTQRDIVGPGTRHVSIAYDPTTMATKAAAGVLRYTYPYAMLPKTVTIDVNTLQGAHPHHLDSYTYSRPDVSTTWNSNGTYQLMDAYEIDHNWYDCATQDGSVCSGIKHTLGIEIDKFWRDTYGNITKHSHGIYDGNGGELQITTENTHYQGANTDVWLLSLLDPNQPSTVVSETPTTATTRTTKYTSDTVHGGIASVELEPGGDPTADLSRSFFRDGLGRLWAVTDTEIATGISRTQTIQYQDPEGFSDGVYATGVTAPMTRGYIQHSTRIWRHPGLGLVVEVDDADGLAATRTYDTFGRILSDTSKSGASVIATYQDGPDNGSTFALIPEGKTTRQISFHLDSFGREKTRVSPVSASRVLAQLQVYDASGHLKTRTVKAGAAGATTDSLDMLNTYDFAYDDMGRQLTDCHLVPNGTEACTGSAFDGLAETQTDESGRMRIVIRDAAGHISKERAALQNGTSDATFTYYPFDLLSGQTLSDGSGNTGIQYDVLGRPVLITRSETIAATVSRAGHRTVYNAFGDVVRTQKEPADGSPPIDVLSYTRDELGRLSSILGMGMNRAFYWDAPSSVVPTIAPFAVGKLVDAFDHWTTQVHLDYGPNGLPITKTWSFPWLGQPSRPFGSAGYTYDSQGRYDTITYPSITTAPLSIRYAYDSYTGNASTIYDMTHIDGQLWSATTLDERGNIASESMTWLGAPAVMRTSSYFRSTGQLMTASLIGGGGGVARLDYTYQANGLPDTFGVVGGGSSWTSHFDYDNLGRLTSWRPATNAPTVGYTYDGSGNLVQRSWSGATEIVTYNIQASSLSVDVSLFGLPAISQGYLFDNAGRIYSTPTALLTYNAADEIIGIQEAQRGWQQDTISRDPFGNRLVTSFGADSFLATLDDLYEYRYTPNGAEERCRIKANGKVIGELSRSGFSWLATYYLEDNVGNVVAEAAQDSGIVSVRARRDPFGNAFPDAQYPFLDDDPSGTDPDGSGRLGYGGHPRDVNWGLVDMSARFYSPRLGRFLAPDSVLARPFDRRDHNPYAYAWNNPVAVVDPSGHKTEDPRDPTPLPPVTPNDPPPSSGPPPFLCLQCARPSPSPPPPRPSSDPKSVAHGVPNSANALAAANAGLRANAVTQSGNSRNGQYIGPEGGLWADGPNKTLGNPHFQIPDTSMTWRIVGEGAMLFVNGPEGLLEVGAGRLGIRVTEKGLGIVERHLAQDAFEQVAHNRAMIERLRSALSSGARTQGPDAAFYLHEVHEATLMARGLSYELAHAAALAKYGVTEMHLYHPTVVGAFPEAFNNAWRAFWNLP